MLPKRANLKNSFNISDLFDLVFFYMLSLKMFKGMCKSIESIEIPTYEGSDYVGILHRIASSGKVYFYRYKKENPLIISKSDKVTLAYIGGSRSRLVYINHPDTGKGDECQLPTLSREGFDFLTKDVFIAIFCNKSIWMSPLSVKQRRLEYFGDTVWNLYVDRKILANSSLPFGLQIEITNVLKSNVVQSYCFKHLYPNSLVTVSNSKKGWSDCFERLLGYMSIYCEDAWLDYFYKKFVILTKIEHFCGIKFTGFVVEAKNNIVIIAGVKMSFDNFKVKYF